MRYIKHILLPDETVLLDARVHPVLMLPSVLLLMGAALLITYYPDWFGNTRGFIRLANWLYTYVPVGFLKHFEAYRLYDNKVLALIAATAGIAGFMRGWIEISFTELAITDRRVVAKVGVTTTTSIEMDRRRVAGVIVHQSLLGRILNYGNIYIYGFSGSISNLPVIAEPYKVQQYLNARF